MPFTPTEPPLLSDENANELGKWMKGELERLAAALDAPDITAYKVLHVEPSKPREGMIVVADGSDWDPGDGPGQYMYIGGQWVIQRSGPEPASYGVITDGTTPASAGVAADTFKLRAGLGLRVATQNNDATHGDNALHSLHLEDAGAITPVLGDKLPILDVSAADILSRITPQLLLDLIGSLTTEASPDFAADFLALYDASGAVAKKLALSKLGMTLISTTNLTGSSVDITVPAGYRDIILRTRLMSFSTTAEGHIAFSEDAGSTFKNVSYELFNSAVSDVGSVQSSALLTPAGGSGASSVFENLIHIHDYIGSGSKFADNASLISTSGSSYRVHMFIAGAAAINLIRYTTTAGNFDQGDVELWGRQ